VFTTQTNQKNINKKPMLTQQPEHTHARERVEQFINRFEDSYRLLAYHASLPLVLTPELVNYLRNSFLRAEVPWVAEIDLLLSDLCSQVGYELYALDTHVRAYLLQEMQRHYPERLREVAQILITYVNNLSRLNPRQRQKELEAQRWAAMVYLGDEKCQQVIQEISQKLQEVTNSSSSTSETGIKAELASLSRLTAELSPQLAREPSLVEYARLIQDILKNPEQVDRQDLQQTFLVAGRELKVPQIILPKGLQESVCVIGGITTYPLLVQVAKIEPISLENLDERVFQQTGESLSILEQFILEKNLEGQTYEEMARSGEYSLTTLKNTAAKLWKTLGLVLQRKINKGNLQGSLRLNITRSEQKVWAFTEDLGNGVNLEMIAIPGGNFPMGSKEGEGNDNEKPQHPVEVKAFFMGRYPVTQAQWREIAADTRLKVALDLDPDPSRFKEDYQEHDRWTRPVERVSWKEAIEFCARLSKKTGKNYRLPSEAEWEYACRAGTETPFHFGKTITGELANYDATETYANEPKEEYRKQTTPVGYFGVANDFGLSDMHGNVFEMCLDPWHDNYEGAPRDGRVWDDNNNDYQNILGSINELIDKDSPYVLRGGSWFDYPWFCRSAYRLINDFRDWRDYYYVVFRLVCPPQD
jgi:formylglycine-generating enzyme required for sulfatase activity